MQCSPGWINTSIKAVIDDGQVIEIHGIFTDISERKVSEEALRESEEKFKTIFEYANDEIAYLDNFGNFIDVNTKVEEIFGYS